jgi:hypothetical protein
LLTRSLPASSRWRERRTVNQMRAREASGPLPQPWPCTQQQTDSHLDQTLAGFILSSFRPSLDFWTSIYISAMFSFTKNSAKLIWQTVPSFDKFNIWSHPPGEIWSPWPAFFKKPVRLFSQRLLYHWYFFFINFNPGHVSTLSEELKPVLQVLLIQSSSQSRLTITGAFPRWQLEGGSRKHVS